MIYLHIGRQKTGSSVLQAFLDHNRRGLRDAGFELARRTNHNAALALTPKRMKLATEPLRKTARHELETARQLVESRDNLIFSSEMFSHCNPERVAKIFPPGKTRIVVYLREQLTSMVSHYAQNVQVTNRSVPFLDYALRYSSNYLFFVNRWAAVFGQENLDVAIYDRSLLLNEDIRADFLSKLNIDSSKFRFNESGTELNITIGASLIEFKGIINRIIPRDKQNELGIHNLLSYIAGNFPGLQTSEIFAESFRRRYASSNQAVSERYLGGQRFPQSTAIGEPSLVDLAQSIELGLAALIELAPDVGRTVADIIKAAPIDRFEPLLPRDWKQAEDEFYERLMRRRRRAARKRATGSAGRLATSDGDDASAVELSF